MCPKDPVGMVDHSSSDVALFAVDCLSKILGSSGYRIKKKPSKYECNEKIKKKKENNNNNTNEKQ